MGRRLPPPRPHLSDHPLHSEPRLGRSRSDSWTMLEQPYARGRTDDCIATLNNASFELFGQGLVHVEDDHSLTEPLHPALMQEQIAGPSSGHRKAATTRNKQSNFSVHEDNMLCKSCLEISCDAVVNTGQRKESFWLRVLNRYNARCRNFPERSQKSIMSRWDYIKAELHKFSGYMADITRSNPSGMTNVDKSVSAAADFAAIEPHSFSLMHCWNIMKDKPKWMELDSKMIRTQTTASIESKSLDFNLNNAPDELSLGGSSKKRPMGRDAAKAAKKKASSAVDEYVCKMHELSIEKVSLFKESEIERNKRLEEMLTLEKVKAEEDREHRKIMRDIEKERLLMDQQRLQMKADKKQKEAEKEEKEEDERILAIDLDKCHPNQHVYYKFLQEEIIENLNARRRVQLNLN